MPKVLSPFKQDIASSPSITFVASLGHILILSPDSSAVGPRAAHRAQGEAAPRLYRVSHLCELVRPSLIHTMKGFVLRAARVHCWLLLILLLTSTQRFFTVFW